MTVRKLGVLIGSVIGALALVLILTTVPLGAVTKAQSDLTATSVGQVDPSGPDPATDCVDISLEAQANYTVAYPLLDVWGFHRVDDVMVGPATVSVTTRPECADDVDSVEGTAYLNAPVCDSGLCEGAYLEFMAGQGDDASQAEMIYPDPQSLPGSGTIRGDWCLEYGANFAYDHSDGVGASKRATTTDTDLCLDPS